MIVSRIVLLLLLTSTAMAQLPDFTLSNIHAPSSAARGQTITVKWTLTNSGTDTATSQFGWFDGVYLSVDQTFDAVDDIYLNGVVHFTPMAPGASQQDSTEAMLPDTSGTFYLFVVADDISLVPESDESNNTLMSGPLTISGAAPDLAVTQVLGPTTASLAQEIQISYTVQNIGNLDIVNATWYDQILLSTDTLADEDDIPLGFVARDTSLAVGDSYSRVVTVILPDSLGGVQYILVSSNNGNQVFEANRSNNVGHSGPIAITSKWPDLIISQVTAPGVVLTGQMAHISYTVHNQGDTSTSFQMWQDQFSITADTTSIDSELVAFYHYNTLNLLPGESVVVIDSFLMPGKAISGVYYLRLTADFSDNINESNESNNDRYSQSFTYNYDGADLRVTLVQVPPTIPSGSNLQFSYNLKNFGNQAAPAVQRWDGIYLSQDQVLDEGDDMLIEYSIRMNAINAGEELTILDTIALPLDLTGNFYVLVDGDALNSVFEYNEENNAGTSGLMQITQGPGPDLTVTSTTVPTSIATGEQFSVSWEVTNSGTATTGGASWYDQVILQQDSSFDQIFLGSPQNVSPLGPGQSYINSMMVTIPAGKTGAYRLRVTADYPPLLGELAETNNVASSTPISISGCNGPDLQVTNFTFPPTAQAGQTIEVSWTVKNFGNQATNVPEWNDQIRLGIDSILSSVWPLGYFSNPTYLGPGESYVNTRSVVIPATLNGNYYVNVFLDKSNALIECNEPNNDVIAPSPIVISLPPPPDLQVTFVTVPPNAFSGDTAYVTYRVQNFGNGIAAGSWYEGMYLSADTIFNIADDELLVTSYHLGNLMPDSGYNGSVNVILPQAVFGSYYIFVRTDIYNFISEHAWENNNLTLSSAMNIVLTPPPDLVVTQITSPGTGNSGRNITMSWEVQNQGPGASLPFDRWFDRVYISSLPTFNPDSASAIGSFMRPQSLAPDSSYVAINEVNLPNGIAGTFYLYVETDWNNQAFEHTFEGNNNTRSLGPIEVALSPWADVSVSSITASTNPTAGSKLSVAYTVTNNGSAETVLSSRWGTFFYLTQSGTLNPATDIPRMSAIHYVPLGPGASFTDTIEINLPIDASGNWYLHIQTDAGDAIYEHTGENNNVGSLNINIQPFPSADLIVESIDAPANAIADQPVTIQWTVSNNGAGLTLASRWNDGIYLSSDTTLGSGDTLLLKLQHEGVQTPGSEYTRSSQIVLPSLSLGNYYVFVKTDLDADVNDGNVSNNIAFRSTPMVVNILPPPDLFVTSFTAAESTDAGQPLALSATVMNNGGGATFQSLWYDGFYLSQDLSLDTFDIFLGSVLHTGTLAPSASYSDTLTVNIPNYLEGTFYLLVKTDSKNHVGEKELEINNISWRSLVIVQPPPGDLTVIDVSAPGNAVPGEEITVSWASKNEGSNTIRGYISDAVYISSDTTWGVGDALVGTVRRFVNLSPGSSEALSMKISLAQTLQMDSLGNIIGILPGVAIGNHYVIVRSDIKNNIHETDETNNAGASGVMSVDVQQLTLGVASNGTLTNHQKKYYRVTTSAGTDLRIRLTTNATAASNELFIAFGRTPTLSDFDFAGPDYFSPNQEIMIPSTQAGEYYILINVQSLIGVPNQSYALQADALPFSLLSISPAKGGKGGKITCTLVGAGFRDTTAFFLEDQLGSRILGTLLKLVSTTKAEVRFDLANADYGLFDVIARNGNEEQSLTNGFQVVPAIVNRLGSDVYTPNNTRGILVGRPATYDIAVENGNNNDIDMVLLTILVPADQDFWLETEDFFSKPVPNAVPDTFTLPSAGIRMSDDWAVMTVLAKNVAAGKILTARMHMKRVTAACDVCEQQLPVFAWAEGLTYQEFLASEVDAMSQVRDAFLKMTPGSISPYVIGFMQAPDWQLDLEQGYREIGLLDDRPIPARTLPMIYDPSAPFPQQKGIALSLGFAGARDPCRPSFGDWWTIIKFGGLFGNMIMLAAAEQGSLLVVFPLLSNPVGWAILATLTAANVYALYKATQAGQGILARFLYCRRLLNSFDPNDIVGPPGYGDRQWIGISQTYPYTIRFENDPKLASAPVQTVKITQKLDTTVDVRSFRMGRFGFANLSFDVPPNRSFYSQRLDVRNSLGVFVDVDAGIDVTTNEAFWIFSAIDTSTLQTPSNPLMGLLPVDDSLGNGEGFVTYTVRARSTSVTGDSLRAQATIVFDVNEPISTPRISNTIDAGLPQSSVDLLPGAVNATSFNVHWKGKDDSTGSGLRTFSIFVSRDDSAYVAWLDDVTDTSATFTGVYGSRYSFFSLATDNAGNSEPTKQSPDASTTITAVGDLSNGMPKQFALYQNYPNPFNPMTVIKYDLPRIAHATLKIYNVLGQEVLTLIDGMESPGTKSVSFDAANLASGVYFYRLIAESDNVGFTQVKKMVLIK